jgi:hypothetical protein
MKQPGAESSAVLRIVPGQVVVGGILLFLSTAHGR